MSSDHFSRKRPPYCDVGSYSADAAQQSGEQRKNLELSKTIRDDQALTDFSAPKNPTRTMSENLNCESISRQRTDFLGSQGFHTPSIEQLREKVIAEKYAKLCSVIRKRELDLKELIFIRHGGSLIVFNENDGGLLSRVEEYHRRHPIVLDSVPPDEMSSEEEVMYEKTTLDPFHANQSSCQLVTADMVSDSESAWGHLQKVATQDASLAEPLEVGSAASSVVTEEVSGTFTSPESRGRRNTEAPTRIDRVFFPSQRFAINPLSVSTKEESLITKILDDSFDFTKVGFDSCIPEFSEKVSPSSAAPTLSELVPSAIMSVYQSTENSKMSEDRCRGVFPFTEEELFASRTAVLEVPNPIAANSAWARDAERYAELFFKVLMRRGRDHAKYVPIPDPPRNRTHWDYLLQEMAWMAADYAQERIWKHRMARILSRAARQYCIENARRAEISRRERIRCISRGTESFWNDLKQLAAFKYQRLSDKHRDGSKTGRPFSSSVKQSAKSKSFSEPLDIFSRDRGAAPSAEDGPSETTKSTAQNLMDDDFLEINDIDDSDFDLQLWKALSDDEKASDLKETADLSNQESEGHPDVIDAPDVEGLILDAEKLTSQLLKEEYQAAREVKTKPDFEISSSPTDSNDSSALCGGDLRDGKKTSELACDVEKTAQKYFRFNSILRFGKRFIKFLASKIRDSSKRHFSPRGTIQSISEQSEALQPTGFTYVTTSVKTKVPFFLAGTLREYQHIGLDWLVSMYERRLNGILADEAGLGKKIITIAFLAYLASAGSWGPHLIVSSTSMLVNWNIELRQWCPQLKVLVYAGAPKQWRRRRVSLKGFNAFHVCLTSYKVVEEEISVFSRYKWFYLILDESRENHNFQLWQMFLNFRTERRLLLTGKPLPTDIMDLWALAQYLMPQTFHPVAEVWCSNMTRSYERRDEEDSRTEESKSFSDDLVCDLHTILQSFLLRRLKADVAKQLPRTVEHVIIFKLSRRQRLLYDEYMASRDLESMLRESNYADTANTIIQLQKICNHPDLFEGRIGLFPLDRVCSEGPAIVFADAKPASGQDGAPAKPARGFHRAASNAMEVDGGPRSSSQGTNLLHSGTDGKGERGSRSSALGYTSPVSILPSKALTPTGLQMCRVSNPSKSNSTETESQLGNLTGREEADDFRADFSRVEKTEDSTECDLSKEEGRLKEAEHRISHFIRLVELHGRIKPLVVASDTVRLLLDDYSLIMKHARKNSEDPSKYLEYTGAPDRLVTASNEKLEEIRDVLRHQFVCCVLDARSSATNEERHQTRDLPTRSSNCNVEQGADERASGLSKERLVLEDSGKFLVLAVLLDQLKQGEHSVLIFVQMVKMMDILEAFLNLHGYAYVRIDVMTEAKIQQMLMNKANGQNKNVFLFILSTRTRKFDVGLIGADTVIFYDTDWNPAMHARAQECCRQASQVRDVRIFRLVSENTIEEDFLKFTNSIQPENLVEQDNFAEFLKTLDDWKGGDAGQRGSGWSKLERQSKWSKLSVDPVMTTFDPFLIDEDDSKEADLEKNAHIDYSVLRSTPEFEAILTQAEDFDDAKCFSQFEKEKQMALEEYNACGTDLSPIHSAAMHCVESINFSSSKLQLKAVYESIVTEKKKWRSVFAEQLRQVRNPVDFGVSERDNAHRLFERSVHFGQDDETTSKTSQYLGELPHKTTEGTDESDFNTADEGLLSRSKQDDLGDDDNIPMFYQVKSFLDEVDKVYPGMSRVDIPYGVVDPDQEEMYLPNENQLDIISRDLFYDLSSLHEAGEEDSCHPLGLFNDPPTEDFPQRKQPAKAFSSSDNEHSDSSKIEQRRGTEIFTQPKYQRETLDVFLKNKFPWTKDLLRNDKNSDMVS
ncbi:helicase domino-like [Schistocerca gregaria]|uniref:helicase domino-like n=1 Tax=Schistocerca gregaria TaxID=7010 RepID=UPI00211DD521|nr:helicase domino-like [Schistocerca gregaria]